MISYYRKVQDACLYEPCSFKETKIEEEFIHSICHLRFTLSFVCRDFLVAG